MRRWLSKIRDLSVYLIFFYPFFSCKKYTLQDTTTKLISTSPTAPQKTPETDSADIVIYGGTSAGIVAAIEAARLGKSVLVICPDKIIGGMTTNGLGATDAGNVSVIGGIAKEFYTQVGKEYGESKPEYNFEPHVALKVFNDFVNTYKVKILYNERLSLKNGVEKKGTAINSLLLESGKKIFGMEFIDAGYEGDLLKAAGVSYTYGRESNAEYGETINGIWPNSGLTKLNISPYIIEGDPTSGLLPRVTSHDFSKSWNQQDDNTEAYNFRLTLTTDPQNSVKINKPVSYNEHDYLLLFRLIRQKALDTKKILGLVALKNHKYDCNNGGPEQYLSSDYINGNSGYIEGDYSSRDSIVNNHITYIQGLIWTLQNSDSISPDIRAYYNNYGLAKDEFIDNNNWPYELYIREARRMVSDYVITEKIILLNREPVNDPVAMGSYDVDSHYAQYYVNANDNLCIEGSIGTTVKPYKISFRSLIPKSAECTNLIVPVCLSASHVAYSSIRMEPQFMMLGQAAATIASIAINDSDIVQNVDYTELSHQLIKNDMIF